MIYFDNAATTPLHQEVKDAMTAAMELFGNPTSVHTFGRQSRVFIEDQRNKAAELLHVLPSELFFTSGGTESLQTVLHGMLSKPDIKRIITTPLEHHAVRHNLEHLTSHFHQEIAMVQTDGYGNIDTEHLEMLISKQSDSLVVLMHANNETGTLLPLETVSELCRRNGTPFLCDTVQTLGKYDISLSEGPTFAAASSHKFHGPKGAGLLYISREYLIDPLILGGGQERNMRSGTENIIGIAGLTKALEVSLRDLPVVRPHIESLRDRLYRGIMKLIPDAVPVTDPEHSLYTILNIGFPKAIADSMLLYRLDIEGVAVSGGSACSSGVNNPSTVLAALGKDQQNLQHLRFSFSRINTEKETDECLAILSKIPRFEKN
jgi:cysteine desulfurase